MAGDDALVETIEIAALPSTVFRYFSDPARFRAWMGPGSEIALEVGGALVVRYPNGDVVRGRVEESVPDRRVAFSWGYESGAHGLPAGSTRVVIELGPTDGGTVVTLRHTGLDAAQRRSHAMGWRFYLAALSRVSTAEQLDGVAEVRIAEYHDAWAETDPARRAALLERCWHPGGTFRDAMAYVAGASALGDHIAGAQMYVPGARIERAGDLRRTHAHACYPWRIVMPGGGPAMTGTNVCEFAADGRLKSVVGFWDAAPAIGQ